ncbi:MAG: trypsin-like serine protease [Corynebacterium sp.]|nr:trypsin-like serine protease [Corynebacterium sp.]
MAALTFGVPFGVTGNAWADSAGGTDFDLAVGPDWLASIQVANQSYCTGALIDPQWVLTAEHCVSDAYSFAQGTNSSGVSGETVLKFGTDSSSPITTAVADYAYSLTDQYRTDITLLHLSTPITTITPGVMNTTEQFTSGLSTVDFGWSSYRNNVLNRIEGDVLASTAQKATYAYTMSQISGIYFAAHRLYATSGNYARGDSGSPIVDKNKRILGVLSAIDTSVDGSTSTASPQAALSPLAVKYSANLPHPTTKAVTAYTTVPAINWMNAVMGVSGSVSSYGIKTWDLSYGTSSNNSDNGSTDNSGNSNNGNSNNGNSGSDKASGSSLFGIFSS